MARRLCLLTLPALMLCGLAPLGGCSPNAVLTLVAPSSNFIAPNGAVQDRTIQVGFINNTPFRAIFTFGAYEPLNQDSLPLNFGQLRLEGNTSSAQIAQPCRRVFSLGGDELIRLLEQNRENPAIVIIDERALIRGVNFSSAPANDPLAAEPTEGTAVGRVVANGIDFSCIRTDIDQLTGSGLLLFTFEQDATAPGGFRIDYSFAAP